MDARLVTHRLWISPWQLKHTTGTSRDTLGKARLRGSRSRAKKTKITH